MTENQSPEERKDGPSPRGRIASARQLHAVLKKYRERPAWTPMEGTLIVAGIHPPPDCEETTVSDPSLTLLWDVERHRS